MVFYEIGDRVSLTYRNFDLKTDAFLGMATEYGTVTRVWRDGKTVTISTDSGKTFVRNVNSSELLAMDGWL
jgi:hypothetical protein